MSLTKTALAIYREKTAAPAYVKKIREGLLSEEAIQRLLPTLEKEREIMNLGKGGSQIADLVLHPEHGLSVRKIPLLGRTRLDPPNTLNRVRGIRKLYKDINELRTGGEQVAKLRGTDGLKSYYDYSKPFAREKGPRYTALIEELAAKKSDLMSPKYRGAGGSKLIDDATWELRVNNIDSRIEKLREAAMREAPVESFNQPTQELIRNLKGRGHDIHDLRPANIIGGNIVDMESGGGMRVNLGTIAPNKVALSKSRILGKKRNGVPQ